MSTAAHDRPLRGTRAVDVHADGHGDRMFVRYRRETLLRLRWRDAVVRLPLACAMPAGEDVRMELEVIRQPIVPAPSLDAALVGPLARMRADPHRYDGTLTALLSLHAVDGGFRGVVAPVSYVHSRCVEQLLDDSFDLRSRDQPAPGHLPRFEDSLLACDIGVVVILETSDKRTVVQRRGDHLDWRAGLLSASASGSLEPGRDFSGRQVGLDGLLAGARRELAEEVGVGGTLDPQADGLRLRSLGIWRELARGGKPELYTVATTPLTFDEVVALQACAPDAHESAQVTGLSPDGVKELLDGVVDRGVLAGIDVALVAGLLLRTLTLSEDWAER